jgi:hypothetical protein
VINKKEPYGVVYGVGGASYQQTQNGEAKLFNALGLEVEISEDGLGVIVKENMPEGMTAEEAHVEKEIPKPDDGPLTFDQTRDTSLTIHERIRIADEKDPNYMTEHDIKLELENRNVSFDKRMGRPKLSAILQNELGE